MKSKALTVSLVLLLIAAAALPGISFSLSSSVTSYNNQIIIEPTTNISLGLYKDKNCETPWGETNVFYGATIGIRESTDSKGNPVYVTNTDFRDISYQPAYIRISGDAGKSSLEIKANYSSGNNQVIGKAMVVLKDAGNDPANIEDTRTSTKTWTDMCSTGVTFEDLTIGKAYLIQIEIMGDGTTPLSYEGDFKDPNISSTSIDITFKATGASKDLAIKGNIVEFGIVTNKYNGVTVTDGHEFVEYVTNNPDDPRYGGVAITKDDIPETSFAEKNGSATATINTDGKHPFRLYIDTANNKTNPIQVHNNNGFKIEITEGTKVTKYPDVLGYPGKYVNSDCYIGSDGCMPNKGDVKAFTGSVSIKIDGNSQQGNNLIYIYIIFDNVSTSSEGTADEEADEGTVLTNRREETDP